MHEKLHAPDSIGCRVRARFDGPGWELFGEGADVRPFPGTCKGDNFAAGGTELGELRGGED